MNGDTNVLFIINKYSGTGYQASMEAAILRACAQHGLHADLQFTQHPEHATELAARGVNAGYQKIVAVGGDGTVNEVARALVHTPAVMGIVPKGSGNGLARHMAIPLKINLALNSLFTAETIAMDTFRINGKLSLNVSGIGFDGFIANLFGTDKKRGLHGYARLILNEFRRFTEFEAHVHIGEKELARKAFVIALANSSQYGNNARIAPAASVSDGLLDLAILKKIPPYRLDFIYQFFSGTIDQADCCEVVPARGATIQLQSPMYFHVDGEPGGMADHFEIEMMPGSLKMLAPVTPQAVAGR